MIYVNKDGMNICLSKLHTMPLWKWALLLLLEITAMLIVTSFSEVVIFFDIDLRVKAGLAVAGAVAVVFCYRFLIRKPERRQADELVFPPSWRSVGKGFIVGLSLMTVIVACIALPVGAGVSVMSPATAQIAYGLCSFFLVAVCEEILFRGVVFRFIDERLNTWTAFVVSGLLFGFAHYFQDNATIFSSAAISIEAGLLLAAAYKQSGTLWVPVGLHWAWNFAEGYVYGAPVSGCELSPSLLSVRFSGSDFLTGGSFGPEASVVSVVLCVVATVAYLCIYYKKTSVTPET